MSNTPRTDAFKPRLNSARDRFAQRKITAELFEIAEALERELAEAKADNVSLRRSVAEAAISISQTPTWIPVSERLREDATPVLIFRWAETKEVRLGELRWEHPGYEDTYQAFRYWDDPINDGQVWEWGDITHWMPLPFAP